MIAMLRIPRLTLDERRKAHLRRWFYDFVDDYGEMAWAFVVGLGICVALFFLGLGADELLKRWFQK